MIKDGCVIASADRAVFTRDAIIKCLYWYGDKFQVSLILDRNEYIITLKPTIDFEGELERYDAKLSRDLIDFQLRDIVMKETKNIRELLVAKAFSNGELDEDPQTEVTDPVGFNPQEV